MLRDEMFLKPSKHTSTYGLQTTGSQDNILKTIETWVIMNRTTRGGAVWDPQSGNVA
jgi:hypothetical protein